MSLRNAAIRILPRVNMFEHLWQPFTSRHFPLLVTDKCRFSQMFPQLFFDYACSTENSQNDIKI